MLKALVSRGHPEFSSNRQQDAHEFLLHMINLVEVSEASGWVETCLHIHMYTNYTLSYNASTVFKFKLGTSMGKR